MARSVRMRSRPRSDYNEKALTIVLDALSAMGLLSKREGRYRCEPNVATHLSATSEQSTQPLIRHMATLWCRWSQLTDIVRGDVEPGTAMRSAEDTQAFIRAMDVVSRTQADSIAAAIEPGSARSLLDVGGGPGTYTAALLKSNPAMKATLFDKPDVIEIARERLTAAGFLDRVTLVPGDFYVDELPAGHDLALVSAIIHQNSPEQNLDLCGKVFRALVSGGRIIIRDHVMAPDRTAPRRGAVFAVNMLCCTAGGNCYTFDEIRDGLTQVGFTSIRLIESGDNMDALVEAVRP